jgi:hypothetical protein
LVRVNQKYRHKAEIVEAFERWTDHIAVLVGEKADEKKVAA